jgi:predicted PurR-regulated permease PerM
MLSIERILMALLLGGIGIGCFEILYPFLSAILWAGILTFTTWPLYQWVRHHLHLGRTGAAVLMVLTVAVTIVLPLALAVPGGADDAHKLRSVIEGALAAGLPQAPPWLSQVPLVGTVAAQLWDTWAADVTAMFAFFKPYYGIIAEYALAMLLGIANGVLLFLLALFIAFFFYAWGDRLTLVLTALLHRIAGARAPRLIEVAGRTVRGVVYGFLGTAVVQGFLTAFGLWAAGVPRHLLLGVVAGLLSVLPIGAPLVWIPSAIWLLTSGHEWQGILLLAYGATVISGADHVIRPYFIARGAHLPFLVTMLGVLGGALAFGLLGVFVGPALLGVGFTLVTEWAEVSELPSRPPAEVVPAARRRA